MTRLASLALCLLLVTCTAPIHGPGVIPLL